jgi:hypothetical protein
MKRNLALSTLLLVAGSLLAADSPKDEVTGAAKALADKSNYSWKTTTEAAGNQNFRPGPTEGKTEKGGCTWLSLSMRDSKVEAVIKGDKAAMKSGDTWESVAADSAAGGGQQGPAQFLSRRIRTFKAPATQAQDILAKVAELKKDGDAYAGDLTEDGAKAQLAMGGRGGNNAPDISGAKGSVKFWVKDGVLSKYEVKVQGKVSFNGNDRDVDRTTTVEIKDVGTTKLDVPEDATKKL